MTFELNIYVYTVIIFFIIVSHMMALYPKDFLDRLLFAKCDGIRALFTRGDFYYFNFFDVWFPYH